MLPSTWQWGRAVCLSVAVFAAACDVPRDGEQDMPKLEEQDAGSTPDASTGTRPETPDAGAPVTGSTDAGRALPTGPLFRQTAADGDLGGFAQTGLTVTAAGALELPQGGGLEGKDTVAAGSYHGGNYYNAGTYRYGVARSREHTFPFLFDEVVPSYDVLTPPGTWFEVKVAVRVNGSWSKDYPLGVWASEGGGAVAAHSVTDGSGDAMADVRTDTLRLKARADALRLTVTLFSASRMATPTLRAVAAVVSATNRVAPPDAPNRAVWGKVLPVPKRSQMIYPNGGEVWCSPTSMTMLLNYFGTTLSRTELRPLVPNTAQAVYDFVFGGYGNWAFNVAHGASLASGALHGLVTRMSSMSQVERLIDKDIPVAISISYTTGELTGSPINSTAGHLIVVKGFSATGDVVCNDPAFNGDARVEVTYKRAELERAWLEHSGGLTYVLWPSGTPLPVDPLGAFY